VAVYTNAFSALASCIFGNAFFGNFISVVHSMHIMVLRYGVISMHVIALWVREYHDILGKYLGNFMVGGDQVWGPRKKQID